MAPVVIFTVLGLVTVGCGNASSDSESSSPKQGTSAPSDGGESNRNVHKSISGVPGVSDSAMTYALVGTKANNPLGTCLLDCYRQGVEAYFAFRNSEGGIYGRDLKLGQITDDELSKNQQVNLGIISDKKSFGTFQAGLLQQGWGDLNDAGVPTYTWGIDATSAANREAIFPSTVIRCPDCTRRVISNSAKQAGATKVGILGYSTSQNSQVCAESAAASVKQYADDTGVEVGYLKADMPYGLSGGVGPEVTAMKKAGVDFITTCFDLNAMKTVAQELQRQGMADVPLMHLNSYDQDFVSKAGDLFDGDFIEAQFRPFEADPGNSSLGDFKKWMDKANSPLTELAMVGWINATLAYDGLLAAGPEFDRAKVLAATNAMKDYTADGLISATDWSTAHTPYTQATRGDISEPECSSEVTVVKGKFEMVGDPKKPWSCWDTWDTEWSEPVPTDFE